MSRLILLVLVVMATMSAYSQEKITISGYVKTAKEKEAVPNTYIKLLNTGKIIVADKDAYFSFTASKETILDLQVSSMAHHTETLKIKLTKDSVINIYLKQKHYLIDGVKVIGKQQDRTSVNFTIKPSAINKLPSLTGQADVMRYVQTLPGVVSGMEGGLSLFVRGGNNGQNRILIDDVPIYAPTHLFGVLSAIPSDMIRDTRFYLSGVPSDYGNLSSSLLKINTKSGDVNVRKGSLMLSPLFGNISYQTPIVKNKLSILSSVRTSFIGLFASMFNDEESETKMDMYDAFFKLKYIPNDNSRFYAFFYKSKDKLGVINRDDPIEFDTDYNKSNIAWQNTIANVKWVYRPSSILSFNNQVYYSEYSSMISNYEFESNNSKTLNSLYTESKLSEISLKSSLLYKKSPLLNSKLGIHISQQDFRPISEKYYLDENDDEERSSEFDKINKQNYYSFFVNNKFNISDKLVLDLGLRATVFGESSSKLFSLDYRLASMYSFSPKLGLKFTVDRFSQFNHTIEGLPLGWATDLKVPADDEFPEEITDQYYLGLNRTFSDKYKISIGAYFKNMKGMIRYEDSRNIFGSRSDTWKDEVLEGEGKSYGLEFFAEKIKGKFTGTLSYTLAQADRKYNNYNKNKRYPFKFDRTHVLNITSNFDFDPKKKNKKSKISAALALYSGHRATVPVGRYSGVDLPYWDRYDNGFYVPEDMEKHANTREMMTSENAYTMPVYFRWDVSYSRIRKFAKFTGTLSFSLYNLTNKRNPYLIYHSDEEWKAMSIFPIVPSVSYRFDF